MSPAKKRSAGRARTRARRTRPAGMTPRATSRPARARRPAPKAAAPRRGGPSAKPKLVIVRKATPRPRPAPSAFPQRDGASPKQLLVFELVRARARVLAALQGLTPASAGMLLGRGKWSIREVALHLHAWDLELERALEPAFRGRPPAWMSHRARQLDRFNEERLAPLRGLAWDETLRRLHAGHARLVETIESLPEEPAAPWTKRHPLGRMLAVFPGHDHHHAEAVRAIREAAGSAPGAPPGTSATQPRTT
jgi:hypothetical protein